MDMYWINCFFCWFFSFVREIVNQFSKMIRYYWLYLNNRAFFIKMLKFVWWWFCCFIACSFVVYLIRGCTLVRVITRHRRWRWCFGWRPWRATGSATAPRPSWRSIRPRGIHSSVGSRWKERIRPCRKSLDPSAKKTKKSWAWIIKNYFRFIYKRH